MTDDATPKLSDLLRGATGRRLFLSRAAVLGTALPALGTALAACGGPEPKLPDRTVGDSGVEEGSGQDDVVGRVEHG